MQLTLCIIAKDEAAQIGALIAQIGQQTLLTQGHDIRLLIVSNGSTDDTVAVARAAIDRHCALPQGAAVVHDTPLGGKARSWNLAVHQLIDPHSEVAIFLDADIELIDHAVLSDILRALQDNKDVAAMSGYPVKDIAKKTRKTPIDRFSLKISDQTPAPHSINGSLYAARMAELRTIWLPVPTPGEDGLLSAMIHTHGFSQPANLQRIQSMKRPTHYFESHTVSGFFRHERRITVGTVINRWIMEHLWAGQHDRPVGPLIREWNETDPDWVSHLIAQRVGDRMLALPPHMFIWRMDNLRDVSLGKALVRAPFSMAATVLNIWPCLQANKMLKQRGAASYW